MRMPSSARDFGVGSPEFGRNTLRSEFRAPCSARCAAIAALLLVLSPSHAGAEEVLAGVAKAEFQLPAHVPLAGYSRRHGQPSTGMHDPVGVRALVLQDGATTAALVSADLLIIDEVLVRAVRKQLIRAGWPKDGAVLLAATHTHSGPGAYGKRLLEKVSMGHFNPDVFAQIASAIVQTILSARAAVEPARVVWTSATVPEFVLNRLGRGGDTDPELIAVGWYRSQAEAPFAVLMTYSAHPTLLGANNMQRSAEYPGAAMREVERLIPGATGLFFAGAVADQGPVKSGEPYERIEVVGRELARRAVEALEGRKAETPGSVSAMEQQMPLPKARVRIGKRSLPRWLSARLVDDDATLSLLRVGTLLFIGAPCDLAAPLGQQLKQAARAQQQQPVLIGFANDYIGYCIPEEWYRSNEYEAGMAFNGPKTGGLIVERLIEMIHALVASPGHET